MELNYPKERWEKIPDEIRKLDTLELDFTDHEDRHLHKMEMDRRIYLITNFLKDYTWTGEVNQYSVDSTDEESSDPQAGLEAFIDGV